MDVSSFVFDGSSILSHPAGDIDNPMWETAYGVACSDQGSTGVVFLLTHSGSFVIKASSRSAEEYFATRFMLQVGSPAIRMRVINYTDPEWRSIKKCLKDGATTAKVLAQSLPEDLKGLKSGEKLESVSTKITLALGGPLDRPQFLLCEAVNGIPLEGYLKAKQDFSFSNDVFADGSVTLVQQRFRELGEVLAVDMFLNNSDRINSPIWKNDGNAGNILVLKNPANFSIVGIDNCATCLDPESPLLPIRDAFERYLVSVRGFLEQVVKDPCNEFDYLYFMKDFIHMNTGFEIDSSKAFESIREGILQGLSNIVANFDGVVGSVFEETKTAVSHDWMNVWTENFKKISLSYLRTMYSLFLDITIKLGEDKMPSPHLQRPIRNPIPEVADIALEKSEVSFQSFIHRGGPPISLKANKSNTAVNRNWSRFQGPGGEERYKSELEKQARVEKQATDDKISSSSYSERSKPLDLMNALKNRKIDSGHAKNEMEPTDPSFIPFIKMQKMHAPEGAIRHKMNASGISKKQIDAFFCGDRCIRDSNGSNDIFESTRDPVKVSKVEMEMDAIGQDGDLERDEKKFLKVKVNPFDLSGVKLKSSRGGKNLDSFATGVQDCGLERHEMRFSGEKINPLDLSGVRLKSARGKNLASFDFSSVKLKSHSESKLQKGKNPGIFNSGGSVSTVSDSVSKLESLKFHAEVDSFVASMSRRRSSRLYSLPREGSLKDMLPLVNGFLCETIQHLDSEILLVFDFDQTLSWAPELSLKNKTFPVVRGGEDSIGALNSFHAKNIEMIIVTAASPTEESCKGIAEEVRRLGLASHFGVDFEKTKANVLTFCDSMSSQDPVSFTVKLALLVVVHTVLASKDLWRIDVSTVSFETDQITGRVNGATFCTRQPHAQQPDSTTWQSLGRLSQPLSLPQKAAEHLHAYITATHQYRHSYATSEVYPQDTLPSGGLFLQISKDKRTYLRTPMTKLSIIEVVECIGKKAGWTANDIDMLLTGEAKMCHIGEGVRFGRCSNIITAGYNKVEAVAWYIKYLQDRCNGPKRKIKRVVFIDDNCANVLSVYMMGYPAISDLSSDSANLSRPQVDAVWFPPPSMGKIESCPRFISTVVEHACIQLEGGSQSEIYDQCQKQQMRPSVEILIMQQSPAAADKAVTIIEGAIIRHSDLTGGKHPDFILLPEGFVTDVIPNADDLKSKGRLPDGHPLCPYASLAKENRVFLICGSCLEPSSNNNGKMYTTTVIFGPSGMVVSVYRKRRIHNPALQEVGAECCIFDTPFGKCAVLICLDAEDSTIVKEILACKPFLIFNPIHIPRRGGSCRYADARRDGSGRSQIMHPSARGDWKIAMTSFAKRFESICKDHQCSLVRCDCPFPLGMGTSQVIGPLVTETVRSYHEENMWVSIPVPSTSSLFDQCIPSQSYDRSDPADNIGARLNVEWTGWIAIGSENEPRQGVLDTHVIGSKYIPADKSNQNGHVLFLDACGEVVALDAVNGTPLSEDRLETIQNQVKPLKDRYAWYFADKGDARFSEPDHGRIFLDEGLRFRLDFEGKSIMIRDRVRKTVSTIVEFPYFISTLTINRASGTLFVTFKCQQKQDLRSFQSETCLPRTVALVKFSHNRLPASLLDFVNIEDGLASAI